MWFASQLSLLSWADLSYVLPITAASYVLTAVLGKIFLHEFISLARWSGICVISAGVMLVVGTSPRAKLSPREILLMSAWFLLIVSVLSGTAGDLLNAKSMRDHGEIHDFRPGAVAHVIAWLARDFFMLAGVLAQAVSFFSFAALLGVADLSFAVPATALGRCSQDSLREIFLREYVCWRRWTGAPLVSSRVAGLSSDLLPKILPSHLNQAEASSRACFARIGLSIIAAVADGQIDASDYNARLRRPRLTRASRKRI